MDRCIFVKTRAPNSHNNLLSLPDEVLTIILEELLVRPTASIPPARLCTRPNIIIRNQIRLSLFHPRLMASLPMKWIVGNTFNLHPNIIRTCQRLFGLGTALLYCQNRLSMLLRAGSPTWTAQRVIQRGDLRNSGTDAELAYAGKHFEEKVWAKRTKFWQHRFLMPSHPKTWTMVYCFQKLHLMILPPLFGYSLSSICEFVFRAHAALRGKDLTIEFCEIWHWEFDTQHGRLLLGRTMGALSDLRCQKVTFVGIPAKWEKLIKRTGRLIESEQPFTHMLPLYCQAQYEVWKLKRKYKLSVDEMADAEACLVLMRETLEVHRPVEFMRHKENMDVELKRLQDVVAERNQGSMRKNGLEYFRYSKAVARLWATGKA